MCVCFQLFFFPFDGVVDGGRRYHVCVCVEWLPTFFLFVLDDGAHFIFFHVHFLSLDFVCVCVQQIMMMIIMVADLNIISQTT